jgi:uncharacterized membrane protein YkvA (DUF1232 family)
MAQSAQLPVPLAAARHYTAASFWSKLGQTATRAGREVVEKSLWLYFAAQRPETPKWAKATVYAALGYLILPLDAVPDIAPVAGYSDDLGVLAFALATISRYVDDGVRARAAAVLARWFS